MFTNFFSPENCAVYEKMWENGVEPGRPQMTVWRMRTSCWMTKVTHTHTHPQNVIFIAFPLAQWLYKRASLLRYTYIACLVIR